MSNRVSQQDYAKRVQVRGIVRHSSVQNDVSIQVRRFVGEIDVVVHHVDHNVQIELCPEFLLLRLPVWRIVLTCGPVTCLSIPSQPPRVRTANRRRRRLLVSHERSLVAARGHSEPAGQIAAREMEIVRIKGVVTESGGIER